MQHTPSSLRASLSRSTDGSEGSGGVLRLLQSSVPPEDLPLDGVKLACSVCIRRSMANSLVSLTCQFPSFLSPCPSWPATGTTPPASRHLQVSQAGPLEPTLTSATTGPAAVHLPRDARHPEGPVQDVGRGGAARERGRPAARPGGPHRGGPLSVCPSPFALGCHSPPVSGC